MMRNVGLVEPLPPIPLLPLVFVEILALEVGKPAESGEMQVSGFVALGGLQNCALYMAQKSQYGQLSGSGICGCIHGGPCQTWVP